jgi:hypothetical protein
MIFVDLDESRQNILKSFHAALKKWPFHGVKNRDFFLLHQKGTFSDFGYFKSVIRKKLGNSVNYDRVIQELSEYRLCSKICITKRWCRGHRSQFSDENFPNLFLIK